MKYSSYLIAVAFGLVRAVVGWMYVVVEELVMVSERDVIEILCVGVVVGFVDVVVLNQLTAGLVEEGSDRKTVRSWNCPSCICFWRSPQLTQI